MLLSSGILYLLFCLLDWPQPLLSLQKCLETLEKYWRIHEISVALFLDDDWLIDSDQAPVQR